MTRFSAVIVAVYRPSLIDSMHTSHFGLSHIGHLDSPFRVVYNATQVEWHIARHFEV